MKSSPATLGGSLKSKPTWSITCRVFSHVGFLLAWIRGGRCDKLAATAETEVDSPANSRLADRCALRKFAGLQRSDFRNGVANTRISRATAIRTHERIQRVAVSLLRDLDGGVHVSRDCQTVCPTELSTSESEGLRSDHEELF